ncbi:glycosyltransferase, partial [Mammaliicoccus sciuri]|uniref:glycosyltransferase n=1 Tax=Mammaliicoccus sciuri TaxID=1296 RepID=UPI000E6818C3
FDKELVLGYVGRFNSIKNQTFLVKEFDEFAKGKNVKLILAGRELEYEKFANYISDENKNKYTWLGETSNPFEVYNSIDALILTSNSEGFPNVIGEAMSIGVPVISTNAGESYQIIGDSGYKIENTKGSLTSKLNELNSNKQRLLLKSQLAYNRIQRCYLIEEKVNQYLNYYKKIYGGK